MPQGHRFRAEADLRLNYWIVDFNELFYNVNNDNYKIRRLDKNVIWNRTFLAFIIFMFIFFQLFVLFVYFPFVNKFVWFLR